MRCGRNQTETQALFEVAHRNFPLLASQRSSASLADEEDS
jgi:hypothetical protein